MRTILMVSVMIVLAMPAMAQEAGWIGIAIEDQQTGGPVIRRVEANSPAESAGLRAGDVILTFDGDRVVGVQQLTRLVRETPVGRTVDVRVRRDNKEETFKVTAQRGSGVRVGRIDLNTPDLHIFTDRLRDFPRIEMSTVHVQSGIRVQQLTDQLRTYFGVTGDNGVLVTGVDAGSAAEKAGLRAGDVITAIDARSIRNPSDFSREMRAGARPVLRVMRDKQEREIKFE
jgi:serine protease Do